MTSRIGTNTRQRQTTRAPLGTSRDPAKDVNIKETQGFRTLRGSWGIRAIVIGETGNVLNAEIDTLHTMMTD